MNKVDLHVRNLLLRYPTLFHDRFEAMDGILTGSSFDWDANGCLVDSTNYDSDYFKNSHEATIEGMIKQFEDKLTEAETKAKDCPDYMARLNLEYVTTAKRDLANIRFIAENFDAYVTTYASVDYKQCYKWLFYHNHHAISKYWVINHPPENIDEEWRAAIYEWFRELLPVTNSLFGVYRDKDPIPWQARQGYEEIFNWVYVTWKKYQDEEAEKNTSVWVGKLIDEILAEEKAN